MVKIGTVMYFLLYNIKKDLLKIGGTFICIHDFYNVILLPTFNIYFYKPCTVKR